MQEEALCTTIVNIEANNASAAEWITLPDLVTARGKAETIVTADNALNPCRRTNNPSSNSSSTSNQSSDKVLRKRSVKIKTALYTATTAGCTNLLCNFANRYKGGCFLHKSQDHTFFQCWKLKKIYSKFNCSQHLQEAEANPVIQPRDQDTLSQSPNCPSTRGTGTSCNTQQSTTMDTQAVAHRVQHIERREEHLKQQ